MKHYDLECEYDPHMAEWFKYNGLVIYLSGVKAMLYRGMLHCMSKEEADREFYETILLNKTGAISPDTPIFEPTRILS